MSLYSLLDQKIIIPLAERLKGRNLTGEIRFLSSTEWLSEKDLYDLQSNKLKRLIEHCYRNVPYYKRVFDERGITPEDIQSREDLAKLPILTKQIIKDNYNDLIAQDIASRKSFDGSTGGSTGIPLHFKKDVNFLLNLEKENYRMTLTIYINKLNCFDLLKNDEDDFKLLQKEKEIATMKTNLFSIREEINDFITNLKYKYLH